MKSFSDVCGLALKLAEPVKARVQNVLLPVPVDENKVYAKFQVVADKTLPVKLKSLMEDAMAAYEQDFSVVVWFRTFEADSDAHVA